MTGMYRWMLVAAAVLGTAAPMRAEGPGSGEVTAVSLAPAAGKTEIVVAVRGAVDVRDFLLSSPDRLVLDVVGATLRLDHREPLRRREAGRGAQPPLLAVPPGRRPDRRGPRRARRPTRSTASADAIRVTFESRPGLPGLVVHRPPPGPRRSPSRCGRRGSSAGRSRRRGSPRWASRSAALLTRADEPRITVTWDRASIADVVAGFAAFSGRTIILGKDMKGEVNAEIKNQPWPQAFQAVLATQGLSAQEMSGGIIRVDAPSALAALDSLEPLETSIVRINYAQAGSLAKTVESILTKNRGRVVADTGSNALILTDTRSRIAERHRLRARARRAHPAALDPGQDHLRRPDRHRAARPQVRPGQQAPSSSTSWSSVPIRRPAIRSSRNVNVIDLGGNSLSAIGNADATITGSALDLIYSTAIGGFA